MVNKGAVDNHRWTRRSEAHVVEVAPIYNDAGGITALAAAEIANSLLKLTVKMPLQATTSMPIADLG
jgi:hypothetical protein